MRNVPRHEVDVERVRMRLAYEKEEFDDLLDAALRDPMNLGMARKSSLHIAACLAVVSPDATEEMTGWLRTGAQAAVALFALARETSGTIEVVVGGRPPVRLPATGVNSTTNITAWLHGFYMALITRDKDCMNALAEVPIALLRQSSSKADDYQYLWARALVAEHRLENMDRQFIETLEATDPAKLKLGPVDWALDIVVPTTKILYQCHVGDEAAYDDAVHEALVSHRDYWKKRKDDRWNDPAGFLALGPLAMASFAADHDMPTRIESDYMPKDLLFGKYA